MSKSTAVPTSPVRLPPTKCGRRGDRHCPGRPIETPSECPQEPADGVVDGATGIAPQTIESMAGGRMAGGSGMGILDQIMDMVGEAPAQTGIYVGGPKAPALGLAPTGTLPTRITFNAPVPNPVSGAHSGVTGNPLPSGVCTKTMWLTLDVAPEGVAGWYVDRYVFHVGTCRVWDLWKQVWCNSAMVSHNKLPRYSLTVADETRSGSRVEWVRLPQLVTPNVVGTQYARPSECTPRVPWTLTISTEYHQSLYLHERNYGALSAPFHAHHMVWTRRGRQSDADVWPFLPRGGVQ